MNPARIMPDLQCALLCEDVRREANGNFIILGIVHDIRVPQVPVTLGQIRVFTRWTSGVGEFIETVKLIAPDRTTVMGKCEVKFGLREGHDMSSNMSMFGQVKLETAGVYYVEVSVDEVMKLRVPVPVHAVPPPKGQQPAPVSSPAEDQAPAES